MGEVARVSSSPVPCVLLAEELKTLRKRTGLSFAALGTQTLYSKSSWSRYLNGEALPPWKAVQALCEVAGEPEPRLRAMWELAEQEWSQRDAVGAAAAGADCAMEALPPSSVPPASTPPTPAPPTPPPPLRWHKRLSHLPGWASMVTGIVLATTAYGIGSWYRSNEPAPAPSGVSCVGATCDGLDATATFCGGAPTPLGTWSVQDETELDLRYSAACRSAWGRVWHGAVGSRVSISLAGKDTRSAVVQDPSESTDFVYTMMVPAVTRGAMLQVCWTPAQGTAHCRSVPVP